MRRGALLLVGLCLLAACGDDGGGMPRPTPTATATPTRVATPTSSATLAPATPTATRTATPQPPTPTATVTATDSPPPTVPTLEALEVHADAAWIRDAQGRVVILRGANYSGLEFGNFIGNRNGPDEVRLRADGELGLQRGAPADRVELHGTTAEPARRHLPARAGRSGGRASPPATASWSCSRCISSTGRGASPTATARRRGCATGATTPTTSAAWSAPAATSSRGSRRPTDAPCRITSPTCGAWWRAATPGIGASPDSTSSTSRTPSGVRATPRC